MEGEREPRSDSGCQVFCVHVVIYGPPPTLQTLVQPVVVAAAAFLTHLHGSTHPSQAVLSRTHAKAEKAGTGGTACCDLTRPTYLSHLLGRKK